MPQIDLTDDEISDMISEPKYLDAQTYDSLRDLKNYKTKHGHSEITCALTAENHKFRIFARQSSTNKLDFTWGLIYIDSINGTEIILRRYNGKSHRHTNAIEKNRIYGYHIHYAKERYLKEYTKGESYAEPTDRYGTFQEALDCMIKDCNIDVQGMTTLGDYGI
ncbi:MAG: hypothetical protein J6X83_04070 [Methanomicrobium sp.]|nr:hypothetical protein [Methanomicrobium sp.]MBP5475413.1 hypothetical protein [Methanomicrobium sp.]